MFDIGWTELLVIAVVLIVVVGPKDLPPMLRAFGKMTSRARKVAGEFRQQFDEALREAELDDVRQTIADAQKLNPMNTLREAMSPLRDMGNEIKADLQRSTTVDQPQSAATPAIPVSEPAMALGESAVAAQAAPAVSPSVADPAAKPKAVRKPRAAKVSAPAVVEAKAPVVAVTPAAPEKPARKAKVAVSAPVVVAAVDDKPKRAAPRKSAIATAIAEPDTAAPKKRATSAKKKDNA